MSENIRTLCERFIANRDALQKTAVLESSYMYCAAATALTASGITADANELKECRKILSKSISGWSYLRFSSELPVLAALYASDDPASAAERISKTYEILKTQFDSTEYLALLAIMLYDLVSETEAERIAERSKTLYKMMKKQHPILTSSSDTLLVGFMSFSEKSDEELVNDCEECYKLLKKTFPNHEDADQSCAQILSMTTSSPEVKTERFIELFKAFKEAGRKYSKGYELAILAALSISDASISEIVETVLEIDSELAAKNGYTGIFGTDKSTRIIHAAMLATIVFGERTNLNVGIPAVSLVMMMAHLIAELVMLSVIAANNSATTC